MSFELDPKIGWRDMIKLAYSKLNLNSEFDFELIYNVSHAVLLPSGYEGENTASEALDLFFGRDPGAEISIAESDNKSFKVAWRIPASIKPALAEYFPAPNSVRHIFQQLPSEKTGRPQLRCTVYPDQITVSLFGSSGLLFAGHCNYESETDILYHIFTLLEKYSFMPEEISMKLNGLVTQESSLFIRLHQYIGELEFDALPDHNWKEDAFNVYPLHFFTHLTPYL